MAHTLADLLPQLRIELPGIPTPVLNEGLYEATDDFLKKSEVWKYSIPGLLDWTIALPFPAIVAGVEIPVGTRVARIDTVKYASDGENLKEVPFRTRQQADTEYPDWEVRTGSSPNIWINDGFSGSDHNPLISPIAVADVLTSLKIRVVLALDQNTLVLPEFLVHEFGDTIRHGTLARLMKIPGRDWTNMSAAGSYGQMFNAAVVKARSRADADFAQPVHRTMSYGGI